MKIELEFFDVNDKLPEVGEFVVFITWFDDKPIGCYGYYYNNIWYDKSSCDMDGFPSEEDGVTHWADIPDLSVLKK